MTEIIPIKIFVHDSVFVISQGTNEVLSICSFLWFNNHGGMETYYKLFRGEEDINMERLEISSSLYIYILKI